MRARFQSEMLGRVLLRLVDQNIASWNPLISWLRKIEALQIAAFLREITGGPSQGGAAQIAAPST